MKLRPAAFLLAILALALPARAEDRTQYFRDITIAPGETVENAVCIFCSIHVRTASAGNVIAAFGSAYIQAPYTGDVIVVGGGVHGASSIVIDGDVIAFGGPLELGSGARVTGNIQAYPNYHMPGQRRVYLRGAAFMVLGVTLLCALVALLFPKRRLENLAATLAARPWLSTIIGIVIFCLMIAVLAFAEDFERYEEAIGVGILLLLTIFALPGALGIALQIGRKLGVAHPVRGVTLGALVAAFLMLIPVAGFLVFLLLLSIACGVTSVSRFGSS